MRGNFASDERLFATWFDEDGEHLFGVTVTNLDSGAVYSEMAIFGNGIEITDGSTATSKKVQFLRRCRIVARRRFFRAKLRRLLG